jgi:hypothetical protein
VQTYRWDGNAYVFKSTLLKFSDCVAAKSRATVKKGYNVVGTFTLRVDVVSHGRFVKFSGAGTEVYIPNAAGLKGSCAHGTYDYAIEGLAR